MTTHVDPKTVEEISKEIGKFAGNIKAIEEQANRGLKEMRDLIDAQGKSLDAADAVAKERIDKFAAEIEAKQLALEKGVDAVKATLERPGSAWKGEDGADEAAKAFAFHKAKLAKAGRLNTNSDNAPTDAEMQAIAEWDKHFATYLRRDDKHRNDEFQAALSTGLDPDGGYLVPAEVSQRVIKRVYESSPMRQFADTVTIGGKDIEIPRDEGEFSAGWVGETESRPETATSQLGASKIVAFELYAKPRATQSMIEDAGLNIEMWIADKIADKFRRTEATAFFTGNGVNKPRGILTYANGTTGATIEQIVSGGATTITADALWNIVYALKDDYAPNARWMMNRLTVRDVMKLKDGQGNYLWTKGDIKAGEPATLCDYSLHRAADMPIVAASSLSVAFGDFREAYTVVDRLGISTLRDPFSAKPYIEYYTRKRVGGDVLNFEAIKLMVTST